MTLEALHNTGIRQIGDEAALRAPEKTLIVVGPARGGTSLVSGTLHHLGVFTGAGSHAPVFEDTRLSGPVENRKPTQVAELMRQYDHDHAVWAFKRPSLIDNFGIVHRHARNPVYLFIFKDIFSIANRNAISMKMDSLQGLRQAHQSYAKILAFIENRQPSGVLLSYDRVMQSKEVFVDFLVSLLPDGASPERRQAALEFIDPNPSAYLDASRVTRAVGELAELTLDRVAGTARYLAAPQKPAVVELLVDGESRGTMDAVPTEDGGGHRFEFRFEPTLEVGQEISLKLTEDVRPFVVTHWKRLGDAEGTEERDGS